MTTETETCYCDECEVEMTEAEYDACEGTCLTCQEKQEAQTEIDEADAELDGMATEMQELLDRISEAKRCKKAAERKLAKLGA